jgi:hypothetical protein
MDPSPVFSAITPLVADGSRRHDHWSDRTYIRLEEPDGKGLDLERPLACRSTSALAVSATIQTK